MHLPSASSTLSTPSLVAALSFVALLSVVTCGGDVVVDDPVSGQGGQGDGASGNVGNQGASGNVGNQGASGNVGNEGGFGNAGNQPGVGGDGPGFCHYCAEEILCLQGAEDPAVCRSPFCPGSDQIFVELLSCVCAFCVMECQSTCNGGGGPPEPDCSPCQTNAVSGPCSEQFNACANDI